MLLEGFAHFAHIGRGKYIFDIAVAVLILQLLVYHNYVLYENNRHHEQLVYEAQNDRRDYHNRQTGAAEPCAVRCLEQHKEALENKVSGEEDVQCLQQLFYYKILEVAGVMQKLTECVQLFALLFGYDENKCEHGRGDSKYNRCYHEADRLTDSCVENTHEITSGVMLYTIFYRIVVTLSSIFGGKYEIFSVKYFGAQYPAGSRSQGACRIAFLRKMPRLQAPPCAEKLVLHYICGA